MNSKDEMSDETFCDLLFSGGKSKGGAQSAGGDSEAAELRNALAVYRTETLQWAERRSAVQPSLAVAAGRSRVWAMVPQWSLAAVAVVTVAAGALHLLGTGPREAGTEAAVTASQAYTVGDSQQIADDNALLSSIDQALEDRGATAVEGLHLNRPPASAGETLNSE